MTTTPPGTRRRGVVVAVDVQVAVLPWATRQSVSLVHRSNGCKNVVPRARFWVRLSLSPPLHRVGVEDPYRVKKLVVVVLLRGIVAVAVGFVIRDESPYMSA